MSDNELMLKKKMLFSAIASDAGTAAKVITYKAVSPVDVLRWGFIVLATQTPGSALYEVNVQRPAGGSDVQVDTITAAEIIAASAATQAAGRIFYKTLVLPVAQTVGEDNLSQAAGYGGKPSMVSLINAAPAGPLHLNPGDTFDVEIATANTGPTALRFFAEIVEHDIDAYNTSLIGAVRAVVPLNSER